MRLTLGMVPGKARASTATMETIMRELNENEMEETSGGLAFTIFVVRRLIQAGWDYDHANASR